MLERIGLLNGATLQVTGRALLDVVVSRVTDRAFAAGERDQYFSRRAANAIGVRIPAAEQFIRFGGMRELRASLSSVAGHLQPRSAVLVPRAPAT
jgi:hypothetical protein